MKLAEEFRRNAEEWRQIERLGATDEHRRRIAQVANTWLAWAERREQVVRAGSRKARKISVPKSGMTAKRSAARASTPD